MLLKHWTNTLFFNFILLNLILLVLFMYMGFYLPRLEDDARSQEAQVTEDCEASDRSLGN